MKRRNKRIAFAVVVLLVLAGYAGSYFAVVHTVCVLRSEQALHGWPPDEIARIKALPSMYVFVSSNPAWNKAAFYFYWPVHRTVRLAASAQAGKDEYAFITDPEELKLLSD